MSNQPRAFISYARKDGEEIAKELSQRLEKEAPGIALWLDRAKMEGGKGWWKQIQDAIGQAKFLIIVMTEGALQSETTRKEWQYARQVGVCVYPVKPEAAKIDFERLPGWMQKAHFIDLQLEWASLLQHLRSPCQAMRVPFMAPDLPPNHVVRSKETDQLLQQVVGRCQEVKSVSLFGAGGFGKTTLAIALCHDDRVIETFDDGILWATLGVKPGLRTKLNDFYSALTGEPFKNGVSEEFLATRLSECLRDKCCLLVIDDVWSQADFRPFLQGGKDCTRLITTRRFNVATEHAVVRVDEMTTAESLQMLTDRLNNGGTGLEPFQQLARRLGECPLAMELANAALRRRIARGSNLEDALSWVNTALDRRGVIAFDNRDAKLRSEALEKTIGVSLDLLEETERLRLFELGTFPEDFVFPQSAVLALWDLDDFDTGELLEAFDDLALVKYDLESLSIKLHDVLRDFYAEKLSSTANLNRRLELLTRVMPLNGGVDREFRSYYCSALRLCAEAPIGLLPEDSCKTLGECWDQFVTEKDAPDLWEAINRIDLQVAADQGFCRVLGKLDVGLSPRGLFLADSGIGLDTDADPTKTVRDLLPDAQSKLRQNFILLTNTTAIDCLCYVAYFSMEATTLLEFFIPFPARTCYFFNAFDTIIPGSTTSTSQRFFGVAGVFPEPIPAILFGKGQFLISIKTLKEDPQSLLTPTLLPSDLGLRWIEEHYAHQPRATESTAQRIVRLNNMAFGHACWEDFDSAESLFREALQLAVDGGKDAYSSIVRQILEWKLPQWRTFVQANQHQSPSGPTSNASEE